MRGQHKAFFFCLHSACPGPQYIQTEDINTQKLCLFAVTQHTCDGGISSDLVVLPVSRLSRFRFFVVGMQPAVLLVRGREQWQKAPRDAHCNAKSLIGMG